MEPLKRGRGGSSSLIPFPRVGRSVDSVHFADPTGEELNSNFGQISTRQLLYGQKRTGKSSLIPFPRVGRRSDPLWQKARGTKMVFGLN